jgi:hypothetical protein
MTTKEYTVRAELTISVTKRVRATSAEEAKDIADALVLTGLCHACEHAGDDDEDSWELGALDGEPLNVSVEE